jgi:hypothetical protein
MRDNWNLRKDMTLEIFFVLFIFCKSTDNFVGKGSGTPPYDVQVCNLSFVHFDVLTHIQARIMYESWVLPVIFVVYY